MRLVEAAFIYIYIYLYLCIYRYQSFVMDWCVSELSFNLRRRPSSPSIFPFDEWASGGGVLHTFLALSQQGGWMLEKKVYLQFNHERTCRLDSIVRLTLLLVAMILAIGT